MRRETECASLLVSLDRSWHIIGPTSIIYLLACISFLFCEVSSRRFRSNACKIGNWAVNWHSILAPIAPIFRLDFDPKKYQS